MPRTSVVPRTAFFKKNFKNVFVDTVLFFALFTIVGHLTINFWERYTIQSELSTMKHSLHTLKDTITNIGKAYDNLHTELKDLFKIVEKRPPKVLNAHCMTQRDLEATQCKNKYTLNHKNLQNIEVQAALTKPIPTMKFDVGILTDDKGADINHRENKSTSPLCKNVATNTKNPLKSTGISSNMSKYQAEKYYQLNDSRCNHEYHNYKCCRDLEYCKRCNRANA